MVRFTFRTRKDTVFVTKYDTIYLQHKPDTVVTGHVRHSRYDRRVHRYRRRWEALIPTHTKIQFAGNMGLLSLGTGWDYGKRNQWETDIFLGVLPKYQSDCTKMTFTLKQNYIPWSLQIKESRFSAEPLTCGMYFNTVFGDKFWVSEPERYPKGYYGFRPKYASMLSWGNASLMTLTLAADLQQKLLRFLRTEYLRFIHRKRLHQ